MLDLTFREDADRIPKGHGAQNVASLRRLAISFLKQEPTKQSVATKRFMAAWDDCVLRTLLTAGESRMR